jgi:hypothetical protein
MTALITERRAVLTATLAEEKAAADAAILEARASVARAVPVARPVWGRPTTEPVAPLTAEDVRSIVEDALTRLGAREPIAVPVTAGLDPELFARALAAAFGAAFGAMLDERRVPLAAAPLESPWVQYAAVPAPVKKSFWTNVWHVDVMLSVLAAVIVLVVLIAWST